MYYQILIYVNASWNGHVNITFLNILQRRSQKYFVPRVPFIYCYI